MAIYLVHSGTGTFFDANDEVYLLDTEDIPDNDNESWDSLDNDDATSVALQYGELISIERKGK